MTPWGVGGPIIKRQPCRKRPESPSIARDSAGACRALRRADHHYPCAFWGARRSLKARLQSRRSPS
jgi:hypothetical protein